MKRFAETSKWDDPWFRGLPSDHKLVFLYLIDRCNNAGFWEIDTESLAFHTKIEASSIEGALKGLSRGIEQKDGWCWIKNFLRHQKNENLNQENPAHRQIIALLLDQSERFKDSQKSLPEGASKGLASSIGKGKGKRRGKGQGEDQEELGIPFVGIRPKWRKLDAKAQSTTKIEVNSPQMIRIGSWFGRQESTLWTVAEALALEAINPDDKQIGGMEHYYTATIPPEKDHRRSALITLLNNWTVDLDRARQHYKATHP